MELNIVGKFYHATNHTGELAKNHQILLALKHSHSKSNV